VRRPQKPFTVEVKRVRKSANGKSTSSETLGIGITALEEPVKQFSPRAEAPREPEPAPKRRILQAIAPPASPLLSASEPEEPKADVFVAETTVRRPRGRPAKVANGAALETVTRPKPPKIVAPAAEVVLFAAPRQTAEPRLRNNPPEPRLSHNGRDETAAGLRRGERWKRRLPKVLW
jgi:hypothetical protein